jgi:hypothetical protein
MASVVHWHVDVTTTLPAPLPILKFLDGNLPLVVQELQIGGTGYL